MKLSVKSASSSTYPAILSRDTSVSFAGRKPGKTWEPPAAPKGGAENGIDSVKTNAASATNFDKKEAKNGQFYFNLKASNGQIIGKSEMYTYLESGSKIVFVNLDDPIQNQKTTSFNRITFSQLTKEATVYIESVEANPFVEVEVENTEIKSNLIGLYNLNVTAAKDSAPHAGNLPDKKSGNIDLASSIELKFPKPSSKSS